MDYAGTGRLVVTVVERALQVPDHLAEPATNRTTHPGRRPAHPAVGGVARPAPKGAFAVALVPLWFGQLRLGCSFPLPRLGRGAEAEQRRRNPSGRSKPHATSFRPSAPTARPTATAPESAPSHACVRKRTTPPAPPAAATAMPGSGAAPRRRLAVARPRAQAHDARPDPSPAAPWLFLHSRPGLRIMRNGRGASARQSRANRLRFRWSSR